VVHVTQTGVGREGEAWLTDKNFLTHCTQHTVEFRFRTSLIVQCHIPNGERNFLHVIVAKIYTSRTGMFLAMQICFLQYKYVFLLNVIMLLAVICHVWSSPKVPYNLLNAEYCGTAEFSKSCPPLYSMEKF
jgi:hypothetical protein